jgi:hypothetical protein
MSTEANSVNASQSGLFPAHAHEVGAALSLAIHIPEGNLGSCRLLHQRRSNGDTRV